jgi:alkanesulfonate monooxygenase SsuD/methylene tetrahydromethanopterin reductase-like flavin-dependent oxidoreductase (luciferase family)
MKKLMAWIKMSGGRMFAALFILTLGLLMFTLSAAYKADNNKDMNSLIDEIGYLGLNSEFPEVRLRMETKERERRTLQNNDLRRIGFIVGSVDDVVDAVQHVVDDKTARHSNGDCRE